MPYAPFLSVPMSSPQLREIADAAGKSIRIDGECVGTLRISARIVTRTDTPPYAAVLVVYGVTDGGGRAPIAFGYVTQTTMQLVMAISGLPHAEWQFEVATIGAIVVVAIDVIDDCGAPAIAVDAAASIAPPSWLTPLGFPTRFPSLGAVVPRVSTALEASRVILPASGTLHVLAGRLDATAPTGTYYVQVLNASVLPADGLVTHLLPPGKIAHTSGVDNTFDFVDLIPACGVAATAGAVVVLSSTEFTKTASGAYLSVGGA